MHPRRLPFFVNSINKIDYVDVALAKNYNLIEAQNTIRDYFLAHDYDSLLFTSDDVEVPYNVPRMIVKDLALGKYDIVTGWSNCRDTRREANITLAPIPNIDTKIGLPVFYEQYRFVLMPTIKQLLAKGKTLVNVWFIGWSITGMSRKVVEAWKPKGWYFQKGEPHHFTVNGQKGFWASSDLWYSHQMWKLGFSKACDLRAFVPHHPPRPKGLLVGIEPSSLEVRPCKV
jgi:hypothetical protein